MQYLVFLALAFSSPLSILSGCCLFCCSISSFFSLFCFNSFNFLISSSRSFGVSLLNASVLSFSKAFSCCVFCCVFVRCCVVGFVSVLSFSNIGVFCFIFCLILKQS